MEAPHSYLENYVSLDFPLPLTLLRTYCNFLIHPSCPGDTVHSGYKIHMDLISSFKYKAWIDYSCSL
jgi:hypothetical protein